MRSEPDRDSSTKRRRHGRLRRWMVRPFFWGMAVVAILFLVLVVYVESDDFERRFELLAIDWLEERLEREISVADLTLDIFPFVVEAREIIVSGASSGDAPFATADRLVLEATVGSLLRPGLVVDSVLVVRPKISVGFDTEGAHDAPRWTSRRRRATPESRLLTEIAYLEVVDGEALVHHDRYPLDFSAQDVSAELVGGDDLELRGRASAAEVEVRLPGARPYVGEIDLDGTFRRGRVDVRQASITGPDLVATASGIWTWGEKSDVDMRIVADSRFELLDRLGYLNGFGRGAVRLEANLRRRPGEWFLDGTYQSPMAVVLDRQIESIAGRVFGDEQGLRFEIDSGRYGGGSLTGKVRMSLAAAGEQPVDVELRLQDVKLTRLLVDQGIPAHALAATASGSFGYRFARSRPRRGDGWASLTVAPASSADGELVVAGNAPLSIANGVVRTTAVRLQAENQRFLANGAYSLETRSGSFRVSVVSEAIEELFPVLGFSRSEPDLWRPVVGQGSLEADLSIDGGTVSTRVRLDLSDVEAPGYSAQSLRGSFRLAGEGVEDLLLELNRPSAAMIVSGSLPLESAREGPPFSITVESAAWPLEDFRPWLPRDPGLGGAFSGGIALEGSVEAPIGVVDGQLQPVRWGGVTVEALDLSARFDAERVRVEQAQLKIANGTLGCEGDLEMPEGGLALRCASDALALSALPVADFLAGDLGGTVELEADVAGTLDSPTVDARFLGRDIGLAEDMDRVGKLSRLSIERKGRFLEMRGSLGQLVEVEGGGVIDATELALSFEVESDRLGDLLTLAGVPASFGLEGLAQGVVEVSGGVGESQSTEVLLSLRRLDLEHEKAVLSNLEPVVIAFEPSGVEVRSLFLADQGGESEVFVAGRLEKEEATTVDLNVQASLATHWFQPSMPLVELRDGTFDMIGHVGGPLENLRLNGQGELRKGQALIEGFPTSLEDISGLVLFYPRRIVLERGRAEVAGGRLMAEGSADVGSAGEPSYRFQISGDDLSFRYPEGWLVHGGAELTVASTEGGRQIAGVARLDSARYLEDVQFLKSLLGRRRVEEGDVEPWRSETRLDLVIDLEEGLEIRNNVADLAGSAELILRGSLARPVVFGRVQLREGGRLIYSGQEYTIERGSLDFANPYRIEPILDLVATAELREYDVTLSLSGTPDRLQADFASNPPLAELEVLALLTGASNVSSTTAEASSPGEASVAAETFLYSQATSLIAGRFNRLFGLDQLRIDPLTSSSGDLSSARVTVGKQLSRDLHVTYSYDPSQSEEQILELEWSISRSLVLVVTQNGDGTYAVDARWEKAL